MMGANQNPEFIVFSGPMFSAKTSSLLLAIEKYRHQKKKIAIFKPSIDDRYSYNRVTSHGGASVDSYVVVTGSDVLKILSELDDQPNVVAVDEAFMVTGIAEVLVYLYRLGVTVLVSTLDISASGKPFSEAEKIFPWATQIHKLAAACTVCGLDAHFTYKKLNDDLEIQVGSHELYEPRCMNHHISINIKDSP